MSGLSLFGAGAGGVAAGYMAAKKMQLEEAQNKRAEEEHGVRMEEAGRTRDKHQREDAAWREFGDLVERANGGGKPPPARQPSIVDNPQAGGMPTPGAPLEPLMKDAGLMSVATAPPPINANNIGTGAAPMQEPKVNTAQPGEFDDQNDRRQAQLERSAATVPMPAGGPLNSDPGLISLKRDDPKAARGNTGDDRATRGLWNNPNLFRNPEFLNQAAAIFTKAQMPDGIKWLEKGYAAQKENAISAVQMLAAGRPDDAMEHFNQSGTAKVTSVEPVNPDLKPNDPKQTWRVTHANGKSEELNPREALRSMLDPKEFFKSQQETAAAEYYGAHTRQANSAADLTDAQADNLKRGLTKDGKPVGPGGAVDSPEKVDKARASLQTRIDLLSQVTDEKGDVKNDPMSGKPMVNRERMKAYDKLAHNTELAIESKLGRQLTAREIDHLASGLSDAPIKFGADGQPSADPAAMKAWSLGMIKAFGPKEPAPAAKKTDAAPARSMPAEKLKPGETAGGKATESTGGTRDAPAAATTVSADATVDASERLGQQLDSAKADLRAADSEFRSYGSIKRRDDPAGFEAARKRQLQARDRASAAQRAYEASLKSAPGLQTATR